MKRSKTTHPQQYKALPCLIDPALWSGHIESSSYIHSISTLCMAVAFRQCFGGDCGVQHPSAWWPFAYWKLSFSYTSLSCFCTPQHGAKSFPQATLSWLHDWDIELCFLQETFWVKPRFVTTNFQRLTTAWDIRHPGNKTTMTLSQWSYTGKQVHKVPHS